MTTVYVTHPRYTEHTLAGHPEHAGRIRSVWQKLTDSGLAQRMKGIEAEPVDPNLILTVHTPKYLELLRWIGGQNNVVHLNADTYALPASFHIARLAAGGAVNAVDAVLSGEATNALAAIRPPGHHALAEQAMGFCLLANIAIAARYAQHAYGVQRVMIVDFDVHHGNGTQDMFYDDDSVLFLSTHQYPFYPGTGAINETGSGKGKGYTINIPLSAGHGDASYAAIYKQIVWPAAQRFQPQLMLVSAGFDAHYSDPLAMMLLSLRGYARITRELIGMAEQLCDGRIVFVMEGGYDLEALGHGVRNIAHALLGEDEVSDPFGPSNQRENDAAPVIERVRQVHGF